MFTIVAGHKMFFRWCFWINKNSIFFIINVYIVVDKIRFTIYKNLIYFVGYNEKLYYYIY